MGDKRRIPVPILCRVCLTKTLTATSLNAAFKDKGCTISEALEKAMDTKVVYGGNFPDAICGVCLGFLSISFDLRSTFDVTQKLLQLPIQEKKVINQEKKASVELVIGQQNFDLQDILIVEENEEDSPNFDGFLNNLGHSITAKFVKETRPITYDNIDQVKEQEDEQENEDVEEQEANEAELITIEEVETERNDVVQILGPNKDCEKITENAKFSDHKCTICKRICNSSASLYRHMKLLHSEQSTEDTRCSICNKTFTSQAKLRRHEHSFHVNLGFLCEFCGAVSRTKNQDYRHRNKHLGKVHQCNICNKKYYTATHLKVHLKMHENKREFLCTICGKSFNYRVSLKYHMRMHNNERNFVCPYCPAKFYMSGVLVRHIRSHTGVRPYSCRFCDSKFFSAGDRHRHELIHRKQFIYCKYCNKPYTRLSYLKKHMSTHTGPYKCDLCTKSFVEINYLKQHVTIEHSVIGE